MVRRKVTVNNDVNYRFLVTYFYAFVLFRYVGQIRINFVTACVTHTLPILVQDKAVLVIIVTSSRDGIWLSGVIAPCILDTCTR